METNGKHPPRRPQFSLGRVYATPGAMDAMLHTEEGLATGLRCLMRHWSGDWGEVDAQDKLANDEALRSGARLLSSYTIAPDVKLWIITEADRSSTTILTPDEY